jgi:hypothetical protein
VRRLLCLYICFAIQVSNAQTPSVRLPRLGLSIGFIVLPVDSGHHAIPDGWAAHRDLWNPSQMKLDFDYADQPLSDPMLGTAFSRWLRDGRMVIGSVIANFAYHEYVVDPNTGRIVLDPMACTNQGCSWTDANGKKFSQPPAAYSEGLQAIYDPQSTKAIKYVFSARIADQSHVEITGEFWTVDTNGKTINRPFLTGAHGCTASPDGEYLACESPGDACKGIQILTILGEHRECVWREGDDVFLRVGFWSPDSKGFAYYSRSSDGRKGWIMYYRLGRDPSHPIQLLPRDDGDNWTAGEFCSIIFSHCQHIGILSTAEEPSSNLGSEILVWSGNPDSLQLYFSAIDRSKQAPYIRTLGSVRLWFSGDGSVKIGAFRPLMSKNLTPTGFAALPPSGTRIAFLGVTSHNDARSQLFVYDRDTKKLTRLTYVGGHEQVFNPSWRSDAPSQ